MANNGQALAKAMTNRFRNRRAQSEEDGAEVKPLGRKPWHRRALREEWQTL